MNSSEEAKRPDIPKGAIGQDKECRIWPGAKWVRKSQTVLRFKIQGFFDLISSTHLWKRYRKGYPRDDRWIEGVPTHQKRFQDQTNSKWIGVEF